MTKTNLLDELGAYEISDDEFNEALCILDRGDLEQAEEYFSGEWGSKEYWLREILIDRGAMDFDLNPNPQGIKIIAERFYKEYIKERLRS